MEKKLIDYEGFEAYAQKVRDKYAEKKDIPTSLSSLQEDSTHRLVADTEKTKWNKVTSKVDKVSGKGLSTNDYTNADKSKVDAIPPDPKYTDTVPDLSGYAKKENIPTKVSQLENDKTFKTESEIQSMIEKASSLKKEVVTSLPTTGKDDVIYLVKDEKGKDNNNYLEYLWLNGKYELIGSTQVDLSGYVTKEELGKVSNEQQQQRKNISQHEENIQRLQDDMKQTLSKNDVVAMPSPNTTEGVYSAGAVNQIQSDIMQNFETVQQSFGSMVDEKLNELDIQEFTQQELEEAFK